jgi:hypothetical protein
MTQVEEQTIQLPTEKGQKTKQWCTKHCIENTRSSSANLTKISNKLRDNIILLCTKLCELMLHLIMLQNKRVSTA